MAKAKKTDKELSFFVQNINDDDKFKDNRIGLMLSVSILPIESKASSVSKAN